MEYLLKYCPTRLHVSANSRGIPKLEVTNCDLKLGWLTLCALCIYGARRVDAFQWFTQQQAIQVNIEIMRAFVRLRQLIDSHKKLRQKIQSLKQKFDAIHQLMIPKPIKKRPIGFHSWEEEKQLVK